MMTTWQIMMNFCERGAIPWTSSWDLWELWEACSQRHSLERQLKALLTPYFYGHVRVYTMYIPHSPTTPCLTNVDRNPFMPFLVQFSGRPTKTVFLMLCMRIFPVGGQGHWVTDCVWQWDPSMMLGGWERCQPLSWVWLNVGKTMP